MRILLFVVCLWAGIAWGKVIVLACNKPSDTVVDPVKSRMDIATTLERELGVVFLSYDVDYDGLVTASWQYPDHRIGGTDWTDSESIGLMVNEQRNWRVCMDSDCLQVIPPDRESKYHGKCWRHFPIPELEENGLIIIDAEDILNRL